MPLNKSFLSAYFSFLNQTVVNNIPFIIQVGFLLGFFILGVW